jgi:hypothetical protein
VELCSRDATMMRITYKYGGLCEELIIASAYFPNDSNEPPPTKEMRDIIEHCQSRKGNSSSGVMPMHTTYCGGAPAPTQEEKVLGISGKLEPEYSKLQ